MLCLNVTGVGTDQIRNVISSHCVGVISCLEQFRDPMLFRTKAIRELKKSQLLSEYEQIIIINVLDVDLRSFLVYVA